MKIIVQGYEIETKEIYDIELVQNTRKVKVIISLIGKNQVVIGRHFPYETCTGQFNKYWQPYEDLYNKVKAQWEADKSDIPVFKL